MSYIRVGAFLHDMGEPPQTDVSRPSALPTANLRISSNAKSIVDQDSVEYLEQIEEEWNKKVDVEIETLVDGMVDLVSLASISLKSHRRRSKLNVALSPWYEQQIRCSQ